MQKRSNPFAKKTNDLPINEYQEEIKVQEEPVEQFEEEIPVKYEPTPVQKPQPKVYPTVNSNRQRYQMEDNLIQRDKYTSTMDQSLRRKIKVVCATRGIMFAQFVEEACREKLQREGVK